MELNLGTLETDAPALEAPDWATPFRFAIFGDFSGRANRDATESPDDIASRKGKKIDRENFDEVLAEFAPELSLQIKGVKGTTDLTFATIDDFHADQIVAKVERFDDLNAKERSNFLSAILHHPDFHALEESWLGVEWFLKKAWKGENGVEVVLYDLTRSEFDACLNENDDLAASPLYGWLVEKALKGYNAQPWGAMIGLYKFGVNEADAQVLGRMAKIARHASAPFLAGLGDRVWDKSFKPSKDDADAWQALRSEPASAMLGLAAPGFLVRPPYGVGTKPVEKIAYEEYKSAKDAEHYVLGNAGLFCGALLAKSFTKKNWQFKPGGELEFDQMAMHVARDDDNEEVLITVAEWLLQKQIDQNTKAGFMTLRGVKQRNHVQLARFLPLAETPPDQPSADLIGSWGQKALKGVPRTPSKPMFGGVATTLAAGDQDSGAKTQKAAGAGKSKGKKFDLDDDDDLMAAADALEAKLKAEREAAEAAGGGSSDDPFGGSSDFGSDFGSDSSEPSLDGLDGLGDTPSEEAPSDTPSDEMDPELAALLGDLNSETPSEDAPSDSSGDADLDALMKELGDDNK